MIEQLNRRNLVNDGKKFIRDKPAQILNKTAFYMWMTLWHIDTVLEALKWIKYVHESNFNSYTTRPIDDFDNRFEKLKFWAKSQWKFWRLILQKQPTVNSFTVKLLTVGCFCSIRRQSSILQSKRNRTDIVFEQARHIKHWCSL